MGPIFNEKDEKTEKAIPQIKNVLSLLIENRGMSPHIPNNLNKSVNHSTHNEKIYNINRTSLNKGNNYYNE